MQDGFRDPLGDPPGSVLDSILEAFGHQNRQKVLHNNGPEQVIQKTFAIMAANACLGGIPFRATTRVLFVNTEVVVRNDDDGGLDGPKGVS